MHSVRIEVPSIFLADVASLLVRLGYLYPSIEWSFDADSACLTGTIGKEEKHSPDDLRREIFFQLYREKIHRDTLSIRRQIYEAI